MLPTLILHFGSLLLSVNMVQADPPAIFLKHFFEMRKYVKCRTCESFEARNQNESS